MENLKIKRITDTAIIPKRGSTGAAGFDLYADSFTKNNKNESDNVVLNCGENVMVHTGISMAIPKGYVGLIYPRSGLSCKKGIRLANSTGVIDEDYRGEVIVCLHRDKTGNPDIDTTEILNKGDRIAQIVFMNYSAFPIEEVDNLDSTERNTGGFGSTGVSKWMYDPTKPESEKGDIDKVADLLAERKYTPKHISLEDLCCRIIADAEEDIKASGAYDDGVRLYDTDYTLNIDTLRAWMENTDISALDYKS